MAPSSRTLLKEIQFATTLIAMVIIIAVVATALFILSRSMLTDLRTRSIATAGEIEALLEYPMYIVDDTSAVRIAETFMASGKIAGIHLESTASGVLVSSLDADASSRIPVISRNITRNGVPLGTFTLAFSDEAVVSTQYRLGAVAAIILIAVLLAHIAAHRYLLTPKAARPFQEIFSQIRRFSEGNYDITVAPTPFRDVNVLVDTFNEMAAKIHQKNQEQQRDQEALRAERQYLIDIIDFLPDATFIIDTEKTIVAWNRAAEAMTGVKRASLLGKGDYAYAMPFFGERRPVLIDLFDTPDEEAESVYKYIRRTPSAIYAESFIQRLNDDNGAHLWGVAAPLYDNEGNRTGAIELIRDVTEYKQAEEEKMQLQLQLMQAQKMESVGRLAGGIAHDFNNMLSGIMGQTQLALKTCPPGEPNHRRLKLIQEAAHRSADLVRRLLGFARRQTAAPQVLDLNTSVNGILGMLRRLIGEDIELVWNPGKNLWRTKIDPTQIDQILTNLCVNARDAITGVGRITIESDNVTFDKEDRSHHRGVGDYVMLAVSDDGCGINKDALDQIFEPFYTTKPAGTGTGLGLATVYGIVRQNDGLIEVWSEPGNGSTFKVYLPRIREESVNDRPPQAVETPAGSGETVLLVEDEAEVLEVGRELLEELGYQVLTAAKPSEAIHLADAHAEELQLLITDVVMPEMNGRELAERIQAAIPGLRCLFTSGYTTDVIAHHGILYEGVHFLQKPFSLNDLAGKVRQALHREPDASMADNGSG